MDGEGGGSDGPRLRVLGTLELLDGHGSPVPVSGRRARALLSVYAMSPGRPVPDERVFDALWPGDAGPRDPGATLRTYVMRLRRSIGAALLVRRDAGYALALDPARVDVVRFDADVRRAGVLVAAGRLAEAEPVLGGARAAWGGPPWGALAGWPTADADAARCVELHEGALELSARCALDLGRVEDALRDLLALVELEPAREERWCLLMTALARAGRQADALRAYERARRYLRDEVGIGPSARLRAVEAAILQQAPLPPIGAALREPPVVAGPEVADGHDDRGAARRGPPGPAVDAFVGRAAVVAAVVGRADAAARGTGALVLVTGPAGIGKTRLCAEVAARLPEGMRLVRTACWPDPGSPPLWPWHEVLRRLGPSPESPPTARFPLFEHLVARLRTEGARAPLVVVIDDLHVADEGTLLATRFVAAQLAGLPVLVVATARLPHVAGDREAALLRDVEQLAVEVPLAGLDEAAVAELVSAAGHEADRRTVEELRRTTAGNPLMVRSILAIAPAGALVELLPGLVSDAIGMRVRGQDPIAVRLLARAALVSSDLVRDELVGVTGASAEAVDGALRLGRELGLVRPGRTGVPIFAHELVRQALAGLLDRRERDRVHRAAAAWIAGADRSPAGLVRAAHHALDAAGGAGVRGPLPELTARAADTLVAAGAYREADALLARAIEVARRETGSVPVPLLVNRSRAVMLAGRLAEAHRHARIAVEAAEHGDDPVDRAEAAAGLGSLWPNALRDPVERRQVLAWQRQALAGVPGDRRDLALRLRSRIAMEAVFWDDAPVAGILTLLDEASRITDPAVRLEVRTNLHPGLLGPEWAGRRIALADEMVEDAAAVDDGIYPLIARTWAVADRFLAGDTAADRLLDELAVRADALQTLSVLYLVRAMRVMQLIRAGHLDEAERHAAATAELGTRVQETDAAAVHLAQLMAIRFFEDRDHELLTLVEPLADQAPALAVDRSFDAGLAAIAARAGHDDLARHLLYRVGSDHGLRSVPRLVNRLAALYAVIEAAAGLGDAALARLAYRHLAPHADLPVMASLALVCFGSAHGALGLAAQTFGDRDRARRHLAAAVRANIRLGHRPATALARRRLAALGADDAPAGPPLVSVAPL